MITTDEIAAWLRASGLPSDAAIAVDGEIPPMPDRLVVLTRTGGQGTLHERTFDSATVQVITRDGQRSGEAAENFTETVDGIFMGARPPVTIGGRRVISIDYSGGPPAFMDRDEGMRALYVTTYVLQVARAVQ